LVLEEAPGPEDRQGGIGRGPSERWVSGGQPGLRFLDEGRRVIEVHLQAGDGGEGVPLPASGDCAGTEDGPKPAYQRGNVLLDLRRRVVAPEDLGDAIRRNDMRALDQQELQEGPPFAASDVTEGKRRPVAGHCERPG